MPVEWPQFDSSKNNRLVESPEPFVEEIPQDLQEDLEFWNNIYDEVAIPRTESADESNIEFLGSVFVLLQNKIEDKKKPRSYF